MSHRTHLRLFRAARLKILLSNPRAIRSIDIDNTVASGAFEVWQCR